ncbi:cytochrome ubiquinol oxidase subunit I [Duncaniella muris]|jgi:cytochrome d ubiquinol oxidase subunit I|uniref:cytochrome ubiquinol oxidase subunit I n=1 Tax=Duncaniella muris TaxID=2094150 RepID=UPI000F496808|nr:cytochrome ubiquinol oxidase subunit I [Duncaniella muris]ROS88665.1 cytochrome ubiquinol oxidase subunit I [Muribaculaceae bacterium Isolate-080 (Janvier)]
MDDLMTVVDWSRWQFALTAMYHWLFVPLTLGLSVIVGIMETIYYRTRNEKWLHTTKFWMTLFGINFAMGVATGIILEFEFGTNWSNYSWFVGDIFGAPLAIEGLLAFFMEATFIAVMFFGWKKVSPGFHLASTWLTALGASISALWILIANAWMQYPVGMEFDPGQMRNIMDNFWDVVLSPVAINKFFHAVFDGWVVGAVFVCSVSAWYMMKKRRREFALDSIRIAGWVGLVGILLTLWTGDGSAVQVARVQPMKLAAMEGLYKGKPGQEIVGVGILNPSKKPNDGQDPFLFEISIPYGLSILANHDPHSFVPGIDDLLNGIELTPEGDTIRTDSYAERIAIGKRAHESLRAFDTAMAKGDHAAMEEARAKLKEDYRYFGYGYLDSPEEAVPPVAMTFYSFHIMVMAGGYLLLFFIIAVFSSLKGSRLWEKRWWQWVAILTIPVVWICSEAGWVTAEVGRQPWIIEGLMPDKAAISAISASTVQLTFWMFAAVFTALLIAEITIMVNQIRNGSDRNEY